VEAVSAVVDPVRRCRRGGAEGAIVSVPVPAALRRDGSRGHDVGESMRYPGFLVMATTVLLMGQPHVLLGQQVDAQPPAPEENGPPTLLDPDALPVDITRIQRRLARPPAIRPDDARPVIRVEVFGRSPTIDEILGPDWRRGPTPAGAMTHQEFLNLVTPRDVQGFAAFDNRQALTVAATSFALQWAVRQALKKLDDAITARQKEAAQREVDEALSALRRARREAGLPDQ
jgi:hypothetical protein